MFPILMFCKYYFIFYSCRQNKFISVSVSIFSRDYHRMLLYSLYPMYVHVYPKRRPTFIRVLSC